MISASDILHGKILIVDDLEVNVRILERMLVGAGYNAISSTMLANEVCDLNRMNRYDLILLDLQMPHMDGFQVMEGLKATEKNGYLPVLVITAQPDQKLRALKAGARDFISKPFDLNEVLLRVYNLLEVRMLHLETQKLFEQVVAEKKLSERLLLNVLPLSIVDRLKVHPELIANNSSEVIADSFSEVTVLFADIVNFTKFSASVSAKVMVSVLNDIFTRFDEIADTRGLEKIKTIGDSYMAAAGLPIPVEDHATRAAHMALDMMQAMDEFNAHQGYQLKIRIGLNSGPVVAGIIGKHKFVYDLWGDAVNTASRMESHGKSGRIQISDATRNHLSDPFMFEPRGRIAVKGKGMTHTWFLTSRGLPN
jgi:adenylate cyclase